MTNALRARTHRGEHVSGIDTESVTIETQDVIASLQARNEPIAMGMSLVLRQNRHDCARIEIHRVTSRHYDVKVLLPHYGSEYGAAKGWNLARGWIEMRLDDMRHNLRRRRGSDRHAQDRNGSDRDARERPGVLGSPRERGIDLQVPGARAREHDLVRDGEGHGAAVRARVDHVDQDARPEETEGEAMSRRELVLLLEQIEMDLEAEIERQDEGHPAGYPATRDGIFLGLTTGIYELEKEALEAWHEARCKCGEPGCTHADWKAVRAEVIQACAVLLRTVRSIDASSAAKAERGRAWAALRDELEVSDRSSVGGYEAGPGLVSDLEPPPDDRGLGVE